MYSDIKYYFLLEIADLFDTVYLEGLDFKDNIVSYISGNAH